MKPALTTPLALGITLALLLALSACRRFEGGSAAVQPAAGFPPADAMTATPLGQVAGQRGNVSALSISNPFGNNPQAIEEGKQLYIKMNCAGCHAYNGKGNMGPDLTDAYWRYGGLPAEIYQSIQQGRPEGMPAWGAALPPEDIWKLVSYIQSFGGSFSTKDYQHARQGDQPGEQVAPEVNEQ
jgi:cytochrome c oxidase cbb3-type subunit 3